MTVASSLPVRSALVRSALAAVSVVALAGLPAGCGSEPSSGGAAGVSVRDSAGVEIVHNAGPGALEPLTVRETLRLGRMEGEGPELFSQVYALALGEDGRIFVGNNASGTVRVFAPDGAFLAELGGRGEGPAEVSMVNDLVVVGDTVGVVDWQRGGKLVLFRSDGTFLANRTFRRADGSRVMPLRPVSGGWLAMVSDPFVPRELAPGEPWRRTERIHLLDFESGEPGSQVYALPLPPVYGMEGAEGGMARGLFPPVLSHGFDAAGRFFLVRGEDYRIDVHTPEGLVRSVRRDFDPRPLGDEDVRVLRERALEVMDSITGGRPGSRERLARRLDGQADLPRPDFVPPLWQVLVSGDGSFWVERRDVHDPGPHAVQLMFGGFGRVPPGPTVWDLFGPEGRFRGTVTLPARFRAEAVEGLQVVGVQLDELDVEHVVRLEVVPGG